MIRHDPSVNIDGNNLESSGQKLHPFQGPLHTDPSVPYPTFHSLSSPTVCPSPSVDSVDPSILTLPFPPPLSTLFPRLRYCTVCPSPSFDSVTLHTENLGKISKQIDNVARGVRDALSSWQAVMDVVHLMFDWSSSAQGRAEVEALLSEAQKADLSKRAVSMHNRTRSLPASVPSEFKTLCKALSGFLISIATPSPSPKCVSQVIRLLAAASAELQKTAAAKVSTAQPARIASSGTPIPLGAQHEPEGIVLAARYRTYAYTCAAGVGQLYSAVSLPALVQTLPTQDVKDLKGSAFQAALDAAEHVLAYGLPGHSQGGGFVYAPSQPCLHPSSAVAVCGVQLARHLLSSALEIANGLSRQHKIQFAETLQRIAADMITRSEKHHQQQQQPDSSVSPAAASMGGLSDAAYLLQLSLQTLELLPAPLPSEASASCHAVRKLQVKLHLSLAQVFMTSHQCDKAFASLTNIDELRGPVGDSEEDRNLDITVQYARFRILLSDGQARVAEGVLFRALLPRAPFEACLDALKVYVSMGLLREMGGPSPGAKAKEAEASILKLYAVLTDRWPRDPEFASSRLHLLKSLLLACPPGHGLSLPSANASAEQPPSAALRLADLVCTEHATRRRVLSSGHLAQLQTLLLSQMGHAHGLGHWAASLALGDSLRLLLHPPGDRPGSAGHGSSSLASAETTGQVLCLQADCYSHLAASAIGQGSCKELLNKAHERAAAAHAAAPSPQTLTLTFKVTLTLALPT